MSDILVVNLCVYACTCTCDSEGGATCMYIASTAEGEVVMMPSMEKLSRQHKALSPSKLQLLLLLLPTI